MIDAAVIVNPYSGRNKHKGPQGRGEEIKALGKKYGLRVEPFFPDEAQGGFVHSDLYRGAVGRALEERPAMLICDSGDGGSHYIFTAMLGLNVSPEESPLLANGRGGTMNVWAENLGFPRRFPWHWGRVSTADFTIGEIFRKYRRAGPEGMRSDAAERNFVHVHNPQGKIGQRDLYGFSYASGLLFHIIDVYESNGGHHRNAWNLIKMGVLADLPHFKDKPDIRALLERCYQTTRASVAISEYDEGELARLSPTERDFGFIYVGAMALRMDFAIAELFVEDLNGIDDTTDLTIFHTDPLVHRAVRKNLFRVFNRKGIVRESLDFPGFERTPITKEGGVRIDFTKGHQFIMDAEPYALEGEGSLTLRGTELYPWVKLEKFSLWERLLLDIGFSRKPLALEERVCS